MVSILFLFPAFIIITNFKSDHKYVEERKRDVSPPASYLRSRSYKYVFFNSTSHYLGFTHWLSVQRTEKAIYRHHIFQIYLDKPISFSLNEGCRTSFPIFKSLSQIPSLSRYQPYSVNLMIRTYSIFLFTGRSIRKK